MEKSSTSKAAESCFSNVILPEDIVVEILSRLSLASLQRFTCVSKRWRSLISDVSAAKAGSPAVLLVSGSRACSFSPRSIDRHNHAYAERVSVPWNIRTWMNSFPGFESWDHVTGCCLCASTWTCSCGIHRVRSGLCYDSNSDE